MDIVGAAIDGKDHERVIRRAHAERCLFIATWRETMSCPVGPSSVGDGLLNMIGSILSYGKEDQAPICVCMQYQWAA